MINLRIVEKNELITYQKLKRNAFELLYKKYLDKANPYNESFEKLKNAYNTKGIYFYFIENEGEIVGGICVHLKTKWIAKLKTIFILPEFENHGYAQTAIKILEEKYSDIFFWTLETVEAEDKNCYIYEKLGYNKVQILDYHMPLVRYDKIRYKDFELKKITTKDAIQYNALVNSVVKELIYLSTDKEYTLNDTQNFVNFMVAENHPALLAFKDGNVVGWCDVVENDTGQNILGVGIDKRFRNLGLGKVLIISIIEYCSRKFIANIDLRVRPGNKVAIKIYKTLGFKIIKRENWLNPQNIFEKLFVMRLKIK